MTLGPKDCPGVKLLASGDILGGDTDGKSGVTAECRKWVQSTADEIQEVTLEEVASSTSPLPEGTTAAPAAG